MKNTTPSGFNRHIIMTAFAVLIIAGVASWGAQQGNLASRFLKDDRRGPEKVRTKTPRPTYNTVTTTSPTVKEVECQNGTAKINNTCSEYIDLTSYWPKPKGTELISKYFVFDDEFGKDRFFQIQYHTGANDKYFGQYYLLSTYLGTSWANTTRSDVWYYKESGGQMLEFRDLLFQETSPGSLIYTDQFQDALAVPGYEIKWGDTRAKKGSVYEGSLQYTSGVWGYNKMTVLDIYPTRVVRGKTYNNVVYVSLYQQFGDKIYVVNYTMAPGIGFLEAWYWDEKTGKNSVVHLDKWCKRLTATEADTCF